MVKLSSKTKVLIMNTLTSFVLVTLVSDTHLEQTQLNTLGQLLAWF